MRPDARVYVAGGDTMLGTALRDRLRAAGYGNLVGTPPGEPDLADARQVEDFFAEARPEYVFLAGGASGGIEANRARPAELMRDNLLAAAHVVHAAHENGARKLLYLASSCAYPRQAPQPMRVESLLAGPPEPTSAAYATAKLAGWQLCDAYRRQYGSLFLTAVPANSFGPHDDFSPEGGHVIPGLIRRAHEAKRRGESELTVWGTGTPRREFLFARDLADACLFVMRHYEGPEPINLGGGEELSVAEAARAVAEVVGYGGRLRFDASRPDGAPRKALDAGLLRALGWAPSTPFRAALAETYDWFLHHAVKEGPDDASAAIPVAVPDKARRGGGRPRLPDGPDQESGPPVDRAGGRLGRRL
jgi:GDP-L-fucose synthase